MLLVLFVECIYMELFFFVKILVCLIDFFFIVFCGICNYIYEEKFLLFSDVSFF